MIANLLTAKRVGDLKMEIGIGYCHGTFGELVQGVINERDPFLIPLPINLYSKAIFFPQRPNREILVYDQNYKARQACQLLLNKYKIDGGGSLVVQSQLPIGKGMASSTADIIASLRAVASSFSLPLDEGIISEIATKIEPTDGIMYDEAISYDYINGKLIETLGHIPELLLFGIDTGGFVDTQQFNQTSKNYSFQDKVLLKKAYSLVKKGLSESHVPSIFNASTISAKINQKILPKEDFEEMEKLAETYKGGLIVAHSGTVIGILLDPNHSNIIKKKILKEMYERTGKAPFALKVLTNKKNHITK